jgi:aminoglycoside phosphotransferase (APT) family kinase protein
MHQWSRTLGEEEEEQFASIIASINLLHLQELALTTRRNLFQDLAPDVSCIASTPPRVGSFNIVYKLTFSDGIKWVIRVPAEGDVFSPAHSRTLHLDIISQRLIFYKTSIPVPQIHYWSLDANNLLSRPFVMMDFMPGMNLSKVWNDNSWITDLKREMIFEQIARWTVELAALEFDQIGCLDWDSTSGLHHIVPFPDASALFTGVYCEEKGDALTAGPFDTAHAFLSFLLSTRRHISDSPMLAVVQLFLSALPDNTLDGPPFVLSHPDFDSQNVLVGEDGTITGIIDWDNVHVGPRQGAAAAYPSWLTVDWDPLYYGWSKDASPEVNAGYDSPTELVKYREAYLDAIHRASDGKLTHITRNSHVWTTLYIALCNKMATSRIVDHLSKFMFGSTALGYEVEEGIRGGAWYAQGQMPKTIAEIIGVLCILCFCTTIDGSL